MAQAVTKFLTGPCRCWGGQSPFHITAARVPARFRSCGICGEQSGIGAGFQVYIRIPSDGVCKLAQLLMFLAWVQMSAGNFGFLTDYSDMFFVVYPSPSKQMPGHYLTLGSDYIISHPLTSLLIVNQSPPAAGTYGYYWYGSTAYF
jgi:hypothetical protein